MVKQGPGTIVNSTKYEMKSLITKCHGSSGRRKLHAFFAMKHAL